MHFVGISTEVYGEVLQSNESTVTTGLVITLLSIFPKTQPLIMANLHSISLSLDTSCWAVFQNRP